MITLKRSDFDKMAAHGRANLPEEACGLLGGTADDSGKHVEIIYLIENEDHSNEHFTMSPQAQLRAIQDMRKRGYQPLGNFHTHPETPSRPSEEDKRLALDPRASYMILSLMDPERPVLNSFRIVRMESSKEELVILEDV